MYMDAHNSDIQGENTKILILKLSKTNTLQNIASQIQVHM